MLAALLMLLANSSQWPVVVLLCVLAVYVVKLWHNNLYLNYNNENMIQCNMNDYKFCPKVLESNDSSVWSVLITSHSKYHIEHTQVYQFRMRLLWH